MPVSPDLAANLAKDALAVYAGAEEYLLELIAKRLARGIDQPGWVEAKLAEVQELRTLVQAEVERLERDGLAAVEAAVRAGYNSGVATAGTDLVAVGTRPEMAFGIVDLAKVDALVRAAREAVGGTHLRISRVVVDAYQQVTTETAAQVLVGTQTRRQAAQAALDRYARRGISGFTDRAGRAWSLESYAEMATRTAAGQAAVQGHVDRLVEQGWDLLIVSDAPQECRICRPWEGKVLSATGAVTEGVAGTLAQATAAGLFHPGCRHSTSLYQPGVTKAPTRTADPEGDALRQRQRELERRVRRAKREQAAALDDDARRRAGVKVRAQQAALREHVNSNGLKRQSHREQIRRAI